MNKDNDSITNQRNSCIGSCDGMKTHNEQDHYNIAHGDCKDNPWSLLGISGNDIDCVLNANDDHDCSKRKRERSTSKFSRPTRKKMKGTAISASSDQRAPESAKVTVSTKTATATTTKFKPTRKLPMTTRGRRITEKVSICDKPPKQRQRAPPRSRRHSLLSIHSEDHDADALQSLTSSTSFLNQSDNRNDRSEIEASDIPVRNYSVANTTPRAIAAMNPETLVSSSVSNSENHFHTMMTSATSSHPQDAYSNDHERQYSQSEFCNQQQPNQQECFQQSHDQSHNFDHIHQHSYLVSQMLELERQYQRSIKRITNSMMQSQNTKWMLQMNGTSIRRRSSLTVGSYRSYGEKSHSRRESQTKLQRRKSSLQFSSKVIYIPNEAHEQEGVDETPNDKTDEDVDFQSTTMSEASDLMSAKRRRSSTSTVVSILKTSADPNSSSQIWSNDDDDDNRNFQSHDDVPASASASAPPATATAPNDSTLPNHQNRPYSMRFQPSTNVEVTREMLYHMLRSSSDGFM